MPLFESLSKSITHTLLFIGNFCKRGISFEETSVLYHRRQSKPASCAQLDLQRHSRGEKGCCGQRNPASLDVPLRAPGGLLSSAIIAGQLEEAQQEKTLFPVLPSNARALMENPA